MNPVLPRPAALLALAALSAALSAAPPLHAQPVYRSAFEAARPQADPKPVEWRAANEQVGALGGHAGHLRAPGSPAHDHPAPPDGNQAAGERHGHGPLTGAEAASPGTPGPTPPPADRHAHGATGTAKAPDRSACPMHAHMHGQDAPAGMSPAPTQSRDRQAGASPMACHGEAQPAGGAR